MSDSVDRGPYETPPYFFDPEDDGIHEYFDRNAQRITKAEWLKTEDAALEAAALHAEPGLPLSSDALHRASEAAEDFYYYVSNAAGVYARLGERDEIALEDIVRAVAEAFQKLRE